jgi:hypothetical protein
MRRQGYEERPSCLAIQSLEATCSTTESNQEKDSLWAGLFRYTAFENSHLNYVKGGRLLVDYVRLVTFAC